MCGIAGILRWDGTPVRRDEIEAMTASIAHRGPDDHGALVEGGLGMGMRRLSIIDLSAAGHQPMFNEDRSVAVVYNGEIYNHRDFRSRLEAGGHVFVGNSDTEVLVHGYEQLGIRELAARLAGMFAFALHDRTGRRLYLVRDGFGIKPLYLRRTERQISFASELRALAFDGLGKPVIDPAFVHTFLRVGSIPSPGTAFKGITKLLPGTILEIDIATGDTRSHRFYQLAPAEIEDRRPEQLLERLRELLNASVRQHLMADVPTGLFLSGGLDSSALALYANQHTAPPKTFSIGFLSSDRGDETEVAAEVARRAGNENIRIDLGPANLDDLDPIIAALEEPLADSATLPLWHLCRGTAAHVKVALSGEGGDEVLGGYARYFWGPMIDRAGPVLRPYSDQILNVTGQLPSRSLGVFNVVRRAAKVAQTVKLDSPARYLSWFDIFTADERGALVGQGFDGAAERYEALFKAAGELRLDPVQRLQYVDFHTMLLDNLLLKADKISMAHSLEVRVPFLSRSLVEFGLGLPQAQKIGFLRDKRLMRRLLRPRLGVRITDRPKRGFEIPVDRWFREPGAESLRNDLRAGALVQHLGFSARAIDSLIARHLGGQDIGRKLFALTALERWAKIYA
ncbi:MAG TPA: asparagine synthase (glutamine-hydrolyzing) [Polyangia bacterium]|jgi:asparagine synthase (glutamine-hydrolysing)|nr:asparagine synthase (glutamine-hydrolyzing) [Polyangia bacterium]